GRTLLPPWAAQNGQRVRLFGAIAPSWPRLPPRPRPAAGRWGRGGGFRPGLKSADIEPAAPMAQSLTQRRDSSGHRRGPAAETVRQATPGHVLRTRPPVGGGLAVNALVFQ